METESPYLTVDEAAAYTKLSKQHLYNHSREIPRLPGTGKLLFRRADLDRWLSTPRQPKRGRRPGRKAVR